MEIFSEEEAVGIIKEWISRYAPDLVHEIKECCSKPFEKGERKNDMVALLKEQVFQNLVSDLKMKQNKENQTRGELIKLIEYYITHPEIVDMERDLLALAKAEGGLLESVLKLLARDQFDPVGCVILAQQDREIQVDKVSPLLEVDID